MLYFLNELPSHSTIECDICIIGSGFAGLAIAHRLSKHKSMKVVVMEGSSSWYGTISAHCRPPNPPEQQLYQGFVSGWIEKADRQYLLNSRLRALGGTSSLWSGWTLALEEADFSKNKSHPWPIPYEQVASYYPQAKQFLNLKDGNYDRPEEWIFDSPYDDLELIPTDDSPLRSRVLQLNPIRLQQHYMSLFSDQIDLYRNANLVELNSVSCSSTKVVQEARFLAFDGLNCGHSLHVKATYFVLALGALETTRQLLIAGFKNEWIGRNFIEHPYVWQAASFSHSLMPLPMKRFYDASQPLFRRDGSGFVGMLVPTDAWLMNQKIGSFRSLLYMPHNKRGWLNLCFEQLPHERCSISLATQNDPFGNPLIRLQSHWDKSDTETLHCAIETTCQLLKDKNLISSIKIPSPKIIPGFHPAGTTRMGASISAGVVDENCRVFESSNLFIASSSIFPTCGYANPTLTIVALAQRLADHLSKEYLYA